MSKTIVVFDKVAKVLRRLPPQILDRLYKWASDVERIGIERVRQITGYHDEPLKGRRRGQRSIRLNKSYRAIYVMNQKQEVKIIFVEEVHKHEY